MELCSLPAIYLGPGGSDGKASVYNVGDLGSIPGFDPWVGKFPGEGNGNPLQYSCLEDPGVHGVSMVSSDTTERLHFHW